MRVSKQAYYIQPFCFSKYAKVHKVFFFSPHMSHLVHVVHGPPLTPETSGQSDNRVDTGHKVRNEKLGPFTDFFGHLHCQEWMSGRSRLIMISDCHSREPPPCFINSLLACLSIPSHSPLRSKGQLFMMSHRRRTPIHKYKKDKYKYLQKIYIVCCNMSLYSGWWDELYRNPNDNTEIS